MYQKIMIPLDGSKLAECVLPHAEAFFKNGLIKTAVFLRVMEPLPLRLYDDVAESFMTSAYENAYGQKLATWEKLEQERKTAVETYLKQIAAPFTQYGSEVKCEVLEGRVAETIASYAEQNGIDLILIATHGRSGVGRWLMGSVADRVLRSSRIPVMMINATGCAGAEND